MAEWKLLAQRGEGAWISRCPGGHIHLDYGNVTLRFSEEDFRAFAAMVGEAKANQDGALPFTGLMALSTGKYTITYSNN
jgi:hypothetical protein